MFGKAKNDFEAIMFSTKKGKEIEVSCGTARTSPTMVDMFVARCDRCRSFSFSCRDLTCSPRSVQTVTLASVKSLMVDMDREGVSKG